METILELDEREQRGYALHPQQVEEYLRWEEAAAWPED
jgi:hypothetical protein